MTKKVEAKSGPELVSQMGMDAHAAVFSEGMEVKGLAQSYIRLIKKKPTPAQSTREKARSELIQAQNRLVGTLNIINFFDSLGESSHFGSTGSGN